MQLLILLFFIPSMYAINYLTNSQWSLIKYILKHPQRTDYMVDTIHQVLYQHYKYKAYDVAYNFKMKYSILCNHIPTTEIKQYAAKGLMMAIKTYNPTYPFSTHMLLYINNQLYSGLSDLHPLTILPKKLRLSKVWRNDNRSLYKTLTNTKLVGDDSFLYDSIQYKKSPETTHLENISKYKMLTEIWSIIKSLDVEYQTVMKYKYNFNLHKLRSNKHVAEFMSCSVETIRKKLLTIQNIIQKECKKL